MFWADILQLTRTVTQKQKHIRDFPRTVDFDGLGLCFHFGWWCCLCADLVVSELYDLKGTSIIESGVLRSGALLQGDLWTETLFFLNQSAAGQ